MKAKSKRVLICNMSKGGTFYGYWHDSQDPTVRGTWSCLPGAFVNVDMNSDGPWVLGYGGPRSGRIHFVDSSAQDQLVGIAVFANGPVFSSNATQLCPQ